MKLTPKDLTTLEGIFQKMVDLAEVRINLTSKEYIDALRKGYVTRATPCCKPWEMYYEWWENNATGRGVGDLEIKVSRLTFKGEGFNYCPFCGVKL